MRPEPVAVRSVIDSVEESLRTQILDQEISPGAPVRETDVARAFKVARPTAKAAIERLVAAGLLTRDVHRRAQVPSMNAADVRDLYFSRTILEGGIVHRLASTGSLPPTARQSIKTLRELGGHAPPTQYVAPDIEFHMTLAGHLESERVTRMHSALMQEMHFCMAQVQVHDLLSPAQIVAEHERIADAIEHRDPTTATRELQLHLERARDALVEFLNASGPERTGHDSQQTRQAART